MLKLLVFIIACSALDFDYDDGNYFSFDLEDYDGYEYDLSDDNDDELDDFEVDEEMAEDEYDLQFFIKPLYKAVEDENGDIEQTGLKRVEQSVLKVEKELVKLENVDRVGLINVDDNMSKQSGAMGNGEEADIAKEKVKEGKQASELAEKLIPKLRKKQGEILKVLPRREQIRLARRYDLRHRFDFCIPQEEQL